ncbi:aldehyde dehydrogenase family protein [Lujinxingia vulgaris]|uniref:Aldehyde dehydrogenase family protein n=1 Tax=Lujinxingia vulgaris TaxID=2600176 RepID=A0A5C6WWC8_9DELT|nr:aldehyde dehydrogenase family protein [Lujinxingia vulgaris]TXD33736.1 aldehyde dehydrogenase family protein [Lujinxingia vulgaris]
METPARHSPSIDATDQLPEASLKRPGAETIVSYNPANQHAIGEVARTLASQAAEVVERGGEAQRAWRRRPLVQRVQAVKEVLGALMVWREDLLELGIEELGMTPLEMRRSWWRLMAVAREVLERAPERLSQEELEVGRGLFSKRRERAVAHWRPRGVVACVAGAYGMLESTVAQGLAALVAGNTVVVVSDERAPLLLSSVGNVIAQTLATPGAWTTICGGDDLAEEVARRADVVVVHGSASRSRRVRAAAAERLVPVWGRSPGADVAVVLNDADLVAAARAVVWGAMCGAGRREAAIRRVWVQQSIAAVFTDQVVAEVLRLRQGMPGVEEVEVGPQADFGEVELLEELIDDAVEKGAKLLVGGSRRRRCEGAFFEPTVISGVDETMELWRAPVPGPIVALTVMRSPAEASMRCRDRGGPVRASIFSKSVSVAREVGLQFEASVVGINEPVSDLPPGYGSREAACGGLRDRDAVEALRACSRRAVMVESVPGFGRGLSLRGFADAERQQRLLDAWTALRFERGVTRRVTQIWNHLRPGS